MNINDFYNYEESMLNDLKRLIEMETPSYNKNLLDGFASYLSGYIKDLIGIDPEIIESKENGNDIKLYINKGSEKNILLLCHYDTVFDEGTVNKRPFKIIGDRAYGPGIFDMKSGIIETLYALKFALSELNKSVVLLITSDEEIDSKFSRPIIENEARNACYALVMEPSLNGMLKTERSGVGTIKITVHGRSAHAGLDPEKGINAIYGLFDLIPLIKSMNNNKRKLNLDIVHGGTRSNVIPDTCYGILDLRFNEPGDDQYVIKKLMENHGIDISYDIRPPMVKSKKTDELLEKIKRICIENNIIIGEASVSGASDGNFCSYYCPVIDGLGTVGDGAHSDSEYIFTKSLPERAFLLYMILKNI
ncbi:M20/M25/M40 family metallo-hydrolase [Picrophilus oshimae]|uniref:Carboxypeptidase G2 n=1 Tax=Picrophilus torridus (strain ATCC 700027 / DSM 9790 / JCM 10055 / NBRC 100828 / KAW 2/3) TaxID=1122961 RepID=Q6L1J2_PICTO|nr:M20/M25/M40 family metallo-hydrolase [Picrophilus oshimae]AAT43160.1 carboxypeptidase G2 precursor [Picrophilus oshimae DSM 9789]